MRTVALLSLSQLVAGQVGEQLDGCCTMGESCWPDAWDLRKLSRKLASMSFSHHIDSSPGPSPTRTQNPTHSSQELTATDNLCGEVTATQGLHLTDSGIQTASPCTEKVQT